MNAPFPIDVKTLDQLDCGAKACVRSVNLSLLEAGDASRLRHFGFDEGVIVEPLHRGPIGQDPIAIRVGRMTVAIRRKHARAISVTQLTR